MENEQAIIDEIRKTIKASVSPCYENTSHTELYCRCPNCGDSKKSSSSAHFYIEMRPPFKFYCQKCGFSGVLNQEILNKLQIYDNDTVLNVIKLNKTFKGNEIKFVKTEKQNIINYKDAENERSAKALTYFNNRFNVNATLEELNTKFKCICDVKSFLDEIKMTYNKAFDYSNAIGFLSSDCKYLICRDISGNQKIRYSNNAISNDINKSKIYNIRTPMNILEDKVTLVITEGIFDAIGIYYKMYQNSENTIVAAACGKSYLQVIEKFIKIGFLNLDINIYSDADVPVSFYNTMKNNSEYLKDIKINIFYNTIGKDCGVPADQITLSKTVI